MLIGDCSLDSENHVLFMVEVVEAVNDMFRITLCFNTWQLNLILYLTRVQSDNGPTLNTTKNLGKVMGQYSTRFINTVYVKIFAWQKFRQPHLRIAEIFGGINFHQCGKGHHILYVITNTGQKIRVIKISPMRADGEIGEKFLHAKYGNCTLTESPYTLMQFIPKHEPFPGSSEVQVSASTLKTTDPNEPTLLSFTIVHQSEQSQI